MTALLVLGVVALSTAVAIIALVIYNEAKGATAEIQEPFFEAGKDSDYLG